MIKRRRGDEHGATICNVLCLPLFRFGMIYYDVTIIYVYKRPIFNDMYAHIPRMIFFNHQLES